MNDLRVLLDIGPYGLSSAHQESLRRACAGFAMVETVAGQSIDRVDGLAIDAVATEMPPADLDRWPRLRFVQLFSAGLNHLKDHPVWKSGIPVATSSGLHAVPIAHHVVGLLIALAHRMTEMVEARAPRKWRGDLVTRLMYGQTAGIIGYGSIGRACARQLAALGLRVLALKRDPEVRNDLGYNPWPGMGDPDGLIPEQLFGPTRLHDMLGQCDVVVIAAPGTAGTRGMIGADQLAMLRPGAFVINIGRGGIIDEPALDAALRSGHLGGAAIDCFATEPLPPESPLWHSPGLIISPHVAGVFDRFWPMVADLLRENLGRLRAGQPIINRADGSLGY